MKCCKTSIKSVHICETLATSYWSSEIDNCVRSYACWKIQDTGMLWMMCYLCRRASSVTFLTTCFLWFYFDFSRPWLILDFSNVPLNSSQTFEICNLINSRFWPCCLAVYIYYAKGYYHLWPFCTGFIGLNRFILHHLI